MRAQARLSLARAIPVGAVLVLASPSYAAIRPEQLVAHTNQEGSFGHSNQEHGQWTSASVNAGEQVQWFGDVWIHAGKRLWPAALVSDPIGHGNSPGPLAATLPHESLFVAPAMWAGTSESAPGLVAAGPGAAAIPAPGTLPWIGLAAGALLRRRRRTDTLAGVP